MGQNGLRCFQSFDVGALRMNRYIIVMIYRPGVYDPRETLQILRYGVRLRQNLEPPNIHHLSASRLVQ